MVIRALLTVSLLAVPIALAAEPQSLTQRGDGRMAPRGDALFKATMLDAHNRARAAYGSAPLVWEAELAADAARYAQTLARLGRFEHDAQAGVRPRQGENLFKGTRGAFSYAAMSGTWIGERRDFRAGRFPDVSRSGDWSRVGHYTQLVWPGTNRFGCAVASNARDDYLVCRYLPAGNVVGVLMR